MRNRDEFAQGGNGLCHTNPTPYVQHRLFSVGNHLPRLFHRGVRECIVAFNGGEVRFQIAQSNLDIFRDINQNRSRATRVCHLKRLCHHTRQLFQRLNEEAVFGAGQ